MKILKQKVFAYITHRNRLLVFRHPFSPEAGIQVPAGTLEADETPETGILREACEETGLTGLILDRFLGEQTRDMADFGREEIHHRYFYHLRYQGEPSETWQHGECDPSDGPEENPILFEFFWAPLPEGVPALIADHDRMLRELIKLLQAEHIRPDLV